MVNDWTHSGATNDVRAANWLMGSGFNSIKFVS
jgi:hypothetical protein